MKKIILSLFLMLNFLFAQVDANLEVVKKANTLPTILVSLSSDSSEIETLNKIKNVLIKDLEVSGHFKISNFQNIVKYEEKPDLNILNEQKIDLFLNLTAKKVTNGSYVLSSKLFDVNSKSMVLEKTYSTLKENRFPFLAHRTAISVNDYFKAPSISWMDRFVVFAAYKNSGQSDIMIGDYTLNYKKAIVKGGLNIFPKWASKEQRSIYYTSYNYKKPTLVKLNIFTRKKDIIMQSEGMIACSDVNSDGTKLLITAAPNAQPDIYLYNTLNKSKKRVTTYRGIDVGGQFIENDKKIVFVSDRLGSPNIFAKNINSRGVEKLVYHSRNNSSATTFNNNIVYVSRDNSNELSNRSFNLYLMSTRSDDLKRLTSNGINQFPKFSSDGESLLFIKTFNNRSSVGIIRLNFNKPYLFPLEASRIQSIDW